MGETAATIPLSDFCPLQRSNIDEATKLQLRNRAVELMYGPDTSIQPNDIPHILKHEFEDRGVDQETADAAVECLGKIYRNNCSTCMVGETEEGFGIISRPWKE